MVDVHRPRGEWARRQAVVHGASLVAGAIADSLHRYRSGHDVSETYSAEDIKIELVVMQKRRQDDRDDQAGFRESGCWVPRLLPNNDDRDRFTNIQHERRRIYITMWDG